MNSINFDNPWLLIIGIPLLLIVIGAFVFSVRKDNRTIHNLLSFIIHIVIVLLVTLCAAKTTFEMVITETNIYVLADVSYSSNQNLDLIDEYIENLEDNFPRNSKIGVICFGKDYEVLTNLGEEFKSVKESKVNKSATNIKEALEFTATLFNDNVIKRIVIISDGEETKESNIVSVVQTLAVDDIYVDAIYLDNNIKEDVQEVQINEIDYVSSTYLNNQEEVYTIIQSNQNAKVFVELYKDNELIRNKAVSLVKGYNAVTFDLDTTKAGTFNYEIKLVTDDDTSPYNNSFIFDQTVSEKVKMLYEESKSHLAYGPRMLVGSGNGLRKSEVWRSIFEKEFDLDLVLPKHSEEAAVGACIFAATANGTFRNLREAQKFLLGGNYEL